MTRAERNVLEFAERMADLGIGGMFTSRLLRKRDAERCVAKGWLCGQMLRVCDGDGCALEPERERWGYVLTDAGREALALRQGGGAQSR